MSLVRYGAYHAKAAPAVTGIPAGVTVRDFNGTTDAISFTSITQTQVSLSAWAFVDAAGNSDFPRVIDMPGYQFYFGKDTTIPLAGDDNTLKFSSIRVTDGVWNTPQGSHANTRWVHVAVTYDSGDLANDPSLYLNAVSQTVEEQVLPIGDQVGNSGTGYLGNNAGDTRALDGKLAHVHIYDRLLSTNEIAQLFQMPGSIRRGLTHYFPLWGGSPEPEYSGNGRTGTLDGTTLLSNGPPINGPFLGSTPGIAGFL